MTQLCSLALLLATLVPLSANGLDLGSATSAQETPSLVTRPPLPLDLPNQNLRDFVSRNPRPLLPQGDWWSLATNLFLFRHFGDTSFMHGPGYWTDAVTELRPSDDLDVNIRLVAANATSSAGYVSGNGDWFNIGVSWRPRLAEGLDFLLRYYDLGRRTIGAGLFFEDREMSGLFLGLGNEAWTTNLYLPGTGVLQVNGDLIALETYFKLKAFEAGATVFGINDAVAYRNFEFLPGESRLAAEEFVLRPVSTLFVRSRPDALWRFEAEGAFREGQFGARLATGLRSRPVDSRLQWSLAGKGSFYDGGILDKAHGSVTWDYLPYSLLFRPYHNAINVLERNDQAAVWSVEATGYWPLNDRWFTDAVIEGGVFDYRRTPDQRYLWHKERLGYCPSARLPGSCASVYISNKTLNSLGFNTKEFGAPVFKDFFFLGMEAQILF